MTFKPNTSIATAITSPLARISLLTAAIIGLSACNSNDSKGGGVAARDELPAGSFLRANNGTSNAGSIDQINQDGTPMGTFTSGANEGLALDASGHLTQASDLDTQAIRSMCNIAQRLDGGAFDSQRDREISGANTGLMNPKGIALAHNAGLILVANFNASQISVFGSTAAGDAMPVAVTPLAVKPWDLAYDAEADRLFVALTDGTVGVYDDYISSGMTASAATRIVTPANADGDPLSVNTHGIVYDAASDRLVLSDVGDAASASDGSLFVISNAASASGMVSVDRAIAGPQSQLGNPVDIELTGTTLRVAEKSNDAILIYNDIFSGPSGDIAPDSVVATAKPESIIMQMAASDTADVSDTTSAEGVNGIFASSNPASTGPTTGQIIGFDLNMNSVSQFDTSVGLESVTFDTLGDAYATYDDGSLGGILIANRVASVRANGMADASRERSIMGAATGLTSPKGLDIASRHGLVFVAENSANNAGIRIFSSCASGNIAPLMTLQTTSATPPWDVDYDEASDRAYVALTNGTVAVYDDVVAQLQAGSTTLSDADRIITPAMNNMAIAAPTNLHGIDFDPASGSLLVTDVGDAASASDGKLYVLNGAASAAGLTEIAVQISGPASQLGNPVDLMFDGTSAYVAEKSNSLVLRFDAVLTSAGGDVSANASTSLTAAESVALMPQELDAASDQ